MIRVRKKGSTKRKSAGAGSSAHSRAKTSTRCGARSFSLAPVRGAMEVESPYAHRRPVTSHESRVTRRKSLIQTKKAAKTRGLHPYVRTMFLSLGIGTAMLLASTLYYVQVSAATAPFLEGKLITHEAASVMASTTTIGMDQNANVDENGVPVKPFPREYLRKRAAEKGFDADLLEKIAHCESNWRMVKNRKSTAVGFFQILDGTEKLTPQFKNGLSKDDPYVNIDMALALYEKYGTIPWYESRDCWEQ
jgi:hypothetical protein